MWIELISMFGISLILTLVIELAVVWIWGFRERKELCLAALVNVLTNPAAVFLAWLCRSFVGYGWYMILQCLIEIGVVAVEAVLYLQFSREEGWYIEKPIKLAIIANIVSWLTGIVVQYMI